MGSSLIGCADAAKVTESVLRQNYAAFTGEYAPGKPVAELIDGLEKLFEKEAEDPQQCDHCGGYSPLAFRGAEIPACPYCGVSEDPPAAPASTTEVIHEAHLIDATNDVFGAVDLGPEPEEKRSKKKKNGATQVPRDEIVEARAISKAPAVPRPSAPVVSILAGGSAISFEKELDEAILAFRSATEATGAGYYDMGMQVRRMHDRLWQQRTDGGKPKYKTFEQFVQNELQISKSTATIYMRIVEVFDRVTAAKYGPTVLRRVAMAPKEDHERLLDMVDGGASVRTVTEEVAKIREKKNIAVMETRASTQAPTAPAIASRAAATARKEKRDRASAAITFGMPSEQMTGKAMAREKRGEDERPAKVLEDEPFATFQGLNGVTLYVGLRRRPSGELEFKITAKRKKSA
jgi:hypothetical protein